jgi:hypothetical protein
MANVILAPEEDEPDFHRARNLAQRHNVTDAKTQFVSVRSHFNPKKVGFGLLPWPGIEQPPPVSDTVAIALQYLLEGVDCSDKEGKK